jgi:tetratricopeptide (TPR) repeat protein
LGELVSYGILIREEQRYQVSHALIHTYARQRMPPSDEAARRLAQYYARFVLDNIQQRERLQSESPNILGAMDWCKQKQLEAPTIITPRFQQLSPFFRHFKWTALAKSNTITALIQQLLLDVEQRLALQITYSLGELAHRSRDLQWAEELYNEVEDLARKKGYSAERAKALQQKGLLARLAGDKLRARASFEEAVKEAQVAGTSDTVATSCNFLGELLIEQGRTSYPAAEQCLLEGRQAAKQSQDDFTAARIVGNLAYLYSNQDKFEKSYALYREERHNLSDMPLADLIFGIVPRLIETGEFDEALDAIQEARTISEEENNTGGMAYTWRLQGNWHWEQEELELAEKSFREEEQLRLLAVEENKEEVHHLSNALSEQHWFYLKTDQIDKAELCCLRYHTFLPEPDWVYPHMLAREADKLTAQKNYQEASQRCDKALAIIEKEGYQKKANLGIGAWIKRIQGNIQAEQGKLNAAEQLYQEGLELRRRAGEKNYTAEDLNLMAEFYRSKMNDEEQARKYQELARQEYQLVGAKKAAVWNRLFHILEKK